MHDFIQKTNETKEQTSIIETNLGTKKETINLQLAKTLSPTTHHLVGKTVITEGVDPTIKYKYPLTTNQQIGWYNKQNIDMRFNEGRRMNKKKLI